MKKEDKSESNEDLPKVLLIGRSHHNGLGLARSFWMNHIRPYGIIVGDNAEKSFIRKSHCWEKTWTVSALQDLIPFLLNQFAEESKKPVIIPWADDVAAEIDCNLDVLKEKFIVPSINNEQGAVVKWMDKQRQVAFAQKYGLPIAKTWTISFPLHSIPNDLLYPCIVKPVASFEGKKADIKKCENREELENYLGELQTKQYNRVLVQEFLNFDYEIELCGCCGTDLSYLISRNLRNWPQVGGTNSFFRVINDPFIQTKCQDIVSALQKENYQGMFDIELFCVKGEIYLNEINWRNTGNSFFCIGTNVHCAVIWYLSQVGRSTKKLLHFSNDDSQYAMNETTDLRHVIFENLSLRRWLKDRKRTKSFALWYYKDLLPTLIRYFQLTKVLLGHPESHFKSN